MAASRRIGAREVKRAELPLLQANEAGAFSGYASLFGVVDSGGDMVMAGAFARSLIKRGASGIKMLWQHQAAEPIGLWASIVEDSRGLKVEGRLDLSVARAREALSLMRKGALARATSSRSPAASKSDVSPRATFCASSAAACAAPGTRSATRRSPE